MRYIGSKTLLLDNIRSLLPLDSINMVFSDPFGGIGTVGHYMKKQGFKVISGDTLHFAHFFQVSLIKLNSMPSFAGILSDICISEKIEEYLNSIQTDQGWFIEEYCRNRQFFTLENAQRIQACIDAIWKWNSNKKITNDEYAILIASLIQSMDKVANTAGTYYAYLKNYNRKALKPFHFNLLQPVNGDIGCNCFMQDANNFVRSNPCDILYLDPPYNTRDYNKYYHLPETIAKGEVPIVVGKAGIPQRKSERSPFIVKSKAESAFADLIQHAKYKVLIFHYTDNGILNKQFIKDVLHEQGKVEEYYFCSKGYTTKTVALNNQHHVYKVIK